MPSEIRQRESKLSILLTGDKEVHSTGCALRSLNTDREQESSLQLLRILLFPFMSIMHNPNSIKAVAYRIFRCPSSYGFESFIFTITNASSFGYAERKREIDNLLFLPVSNGCMWFHLFLVVASAMKGMRIGDWTMFVILHRNHSTELERGWRNSWRWIHIVWDRKGIEDCLF